MKTKKKNSKQLDILRKNLHHWQMMVRIEMGWVEQSKENCREIARQMRKVQAGEK